MPRQISQQVLILLTESLYHGIYPSEQRSNTTPVLPFLGRFSPCCGKELLSAVWHCLLQAPSHAPALELWCCHCVEAQPRTGISCFTRLTRQLLLRCCNRNVTGSVWWEGSCVRSGAVPGWHEEALSCAPVCYLLCLGGAGERSWSICKCMKESWISCSVQGTCATVTGFKTKRMWNLKKDMLGLYSAASWDTGTAIGS